MDMRLYAAIVTEETDAPALQGLDGLCRALTQIDRLEQMVDEAWQMITVQRQAHPVVNYQCVFVAPEYFFSNLRYMSDRFFDHGVKRLIIHRLSALAKKYPHILIVPGTILWTKDLHDAQIGPEGRKAALTNRSGTKNVFVNNNRIAKAEARIQIASSRFRTATNLPNWSHNKTDTDTVERKIAQNVAYICMGDKILKYHKIGNYMEVAGESNDLVFVPGSIVGRFQVGGVKYGIEICMDHAMGVFHSSVRAHGKVHVQIIVSSYVAARTNTDASVTLHSSTEKAGLRAVSGQPGIATTTGTNPIRFGNDGVGKLARPPIDSKAHSFRLWVIDLSANDLTDPMNHKLSSTDIQEVEHIH